MNTLPPLARFFGSLTLRLEPPLVSIGPKLVTVEAEVLRGSTGILAGASGAGYTDHAGGCGETRSSNRNRACHYAERPGHRSEAAAVHRNCSGSRGQETERRRRAALKVLASGLVT
jgi:hypothetical protein